MVLGSGLVVLGLLAALALAGTGGLLPPTRECSVTTQGRTVTLGRDQAEAAAEVAARAVRLGLPLRTTAVTVADTLEGSARDGRQVAAALTGRSRAALSCTGGGASTSESDGLNDTGLTARAAAVRRDLDAAFGRQRVGGFAPGGVSTGHKTGSAHYDGRAVDVFVRPVSERNKTRGWAIAQYLVASAERLSVETVIFDGRIWTARRGDQGWRDYDPDTTGRSRQVAAILEHRDHVHVDVSD